MFHPPPEIWMSMSCQFARAQFQWPFVVQGSISSGLVQKHDCCSGFLAILNVEAIIQQLYVCTRVLTVAIYKVLNCDSLGSTNWAPEEEQVHVLMPMPWPPFRCRWVASHPIFFFRKIPTSHPRIHPDGYHGHFVLHWTNLSDEKQIHMLTALETSCWQFFSIGETGDCLQYDYLQQWRPPEQTLRFLGIQHQWESRNMGNITLVKENVPAQLLEVYNMLCRLNCNHLQAELFVIEQWLIPWEQGEASSGHNLMANFTSLAVNCELLCSVSADEKLLTDCSWMWSMSCGKLHSDWPCQCVIYLQPKPPWSQLAPTNSIGDIKSNMRTSSVSLHIIEISFRLNLLGIASWYMFCARFSSPKAFFLQVDMKCGNNKYMVSLCYLLSYAGHGQVDGFQEVMFGGCVTVGCFRFACSNELTHGCAADEVGAMYRNNMTWDQWLVFNDDGQFFDVLSLLPCDPGDYSTFAWCQGNPGIVHEACFFAWY